MNFFSCYIETLSSNQVYAHAMSVAARSWSVAKKLTENYALAYTQKDSGESDILIRETDCNSSTRSSEIMSVVDSLEEEKVLNGTVYIVNRKSV